jgi:hypothetical protein
LELQKQGLRERVAKIRDAAAAPFAVGEFELITEQIEGGAPVCKSTSLRQLVHLEEKDEQTYAPQEGRLPPRLELCRSCDSYIWPSETVCPHCGSDIQTAARSYEADALRRKTVKEEMERLLTELAANSLG